MEEAITESFIILEIPSLVAGVIAESLCGAALRREALVGPQEIPSTIIQCDATSDG
jgi:hypothetical protein